MVELEPRRFGEEGGFSEKMEGRRGGVRGEKKGGVGLGQLCGRLGEEFGKNFEALQQNARKGGRWPRTMGGKRKGAPIS